MKEKKQRMERKRQMPIRRPHSDARRSSHTTKHDAERAHSTQGKNAEKTMKTEMPMPADHKDWPRGTTGRSPSDNSRNATLVRDNITAKGVKSSDSEDEGIDDSDTGKPLAHGKHSIFSSSSLIPPKMPPAPASAPIPPASEIDPEVLKVLPHALQQELMTLYPPCALFSNALHGKTKGPEKSDEKQYQKQMASLATTEHVNLQGLCAIAEKQSSKANGHWDADDTESEKNRHARGEWYH
mmetsp:Transcript_4784/g.9081  ORF Transcript_4784/g.9081 Transcript_4784/m.9081 type:complete len:240 (-) Transcript_4784:743-1462(-)